MELLNPARVNHMPGSGKSAPSPAAHEAPPKGCLGLRRPGGLWRERGGVSGPRKSAALSWGKTGHWFWKCSGLRLMLLK